MLHLGLYQLFWLQRIPDHAAVHETVELAKRLGFGPRAGFLNAILRGYIREREATREALEALKKSDPALGYSHPAWLVERWQAALGRKEHGAVAGLEQPAPAPLCAAERIEDRRAPPARPLAARGSRVRGAALGLDRPELVFELRRHPPLAACGSFQDGWFYAQDPGTLLAVRQLDPQPGESILDLCAAPGGKTTCIAQRMGNRGRIAARDNQPERLRLAEENCRRLGVTCVEFSQAPAAPGEFDRILVDAPCSNTGVMRRRIDLRWRAQPPEIQRLSRAQAALLAQAAPGLKPGGVLVYSTCSLEPEENQAVVGKFLESHPDFKLENERELLPFNEGVDGAYVAKLRR